MWLLGLILFCFSKIPNGFSKDDIMKMLPSALGAFTENQWGPVNSEHLNTVNETLRLNGLSVLDVVNVVGIVRNEQSSCENHRIPLFKPKSKICPTQMSTWM